MNEQNKQLLQKIVAQIKELSGIEIEPDKDWMTNLLKVTTSSSVLPRLAKLSLSYPPVDDIYEHMKMIESDPQYNMEKYQDVYKGCLDMVEMKIKSLKNDLNLFRTTCPDHSEEIIKEIIFMQILKILEDYFYIVFHSFLLALGENIIEIISDKNKKRQSDK